MVYRDEITIPAFELLRRLDLLRKSTDMLAGAWVSWITGGATDAELDKALNTVLGNTQELTTTYAQYTEMHRARRRSTYARYMWDDRGQVPPAHLINKKPHAKGCAFCKGQGWYWAKWQGSEKWIGCVICKRTGLENWDQFAATTPADQLVKAVPQAPYSAMTPEWQAKYKKQTPFESLRIQLNTSVPPGMILGIQSLGIAGVVEAAIKAAVVFEEKQVRDRKGGKTEQIRIWADEIRAAGHDVAELTNKRPCPFCEGSGIFDNHLGGVSRIREECSHCLGTGKLPVLYPGQRTCPACRGRGDIGNRAKAVCVECGLCLGTGKVSTYPATAPINVGANIPMAEACTYCQGRGNQVRKTADEVDITPCPHCKGTGRAQDILDDPTFASLDAGKPISYRDACVACKGSGYKSRNFVTGAVPCDSCKGTGKRDQV